MNKELNKELTAHLDGYEPTKIFVIFNKEEDQRNCLKQMCVGELVSIFNRKGHVNAKYLFKGETVLKIDEPPEPPSIFYEHLESSSTARSAESMIGWFVTEIAMS